MKLGDLVMLAWGALRAHRLRTRLTYAAIAIGIASVLSLTALGEGGQRWILDRFASLGSNILIALPGRTETRGGPPMAAATTRELTLEDLEAVRRRMSGVTELVPLTLGEARLERDGRSRAATVVGTTSGFLRVRGVGVEGRNLPEIEAERGMQVVVIGRTLARELFGTENALGGRVRIGGSSYRVVGVVAQRGQAMGVNLDEIAMVPVANALRMFNRAGLFRVIVQVPATADLEVARARLTAVLRERHDGEEDFTILTPGAVASALAGIVRIIATALAAIAAISLAIAGIGVMNVMVVSVTERTSEIGLMKALGAGNGQVMAIFLAEAVALSLVGGAMGIAAGMGVAMLGRAVYPDIPFQVPGWALSLAVGVAGAVGIVFGLVPAMKAARMEPLESLRRKA